MVASTPFLWGSGISNLPSTSIPRFFSELPPWPASHRCSGTGCGSPSGPRAAPIAPSPPAPHPYRWSWGTRRGSHPEGRQTGGRGCVAGRARAAGLGSYRSPGTGCPCPRCCKPGCCGERSSDSLSPPGANTPRALLVRGSEPLQPSSASLPAV